MCAAVCLVYLVYLGRAASLLVHAACSCAPSRNSRNSRHAASVKSVVKTPAKSVLKTACSCAPSRNSRNEKKKEKTLLRPVATRLAATAATIAARLGLRLGLQALKAVFTTDFTVAARLAATAATIAAASEFVHAGVCLVYLAYAASCLGHAGPEARPEASLRLKAVFTTDFTDA